MKLEAQLAEAQARLAEAESALAAKKAEMVDELARYAATKAEAEAKADAADTGVRLLRDTAMRSLRLDMTAAYTAYLELSRVNRPITTLENTVYNRRRDVGDIEGKIQARDLKRVAKASEVAQAAVTETLPFDHPRYVEARRQLTALIEGKPLRPFVWEPKG